VRLLALQAAAFRNLAPLDIATDAQFVVVHGLNAQGKTNLLEAIYLLATLKPLRARRLTDLVQWGGDGATVAATVRSEGMSRRFKVIVAPTGRIAWLDGKRPPSLSDYFSGIRAICFKPQDGDIVFGGPSERRSWLDRAAFTKAPAHLDLVRRYRRVLQQKSAALKQRGVDPGVLDALDHQLAAVGARLIYRRLDILHELRPLIDRLHQDIAGEGPSIDIRYRSQATGVEVDSLSESLLQALSSARKEELRRRMTLCGPQRDEVVFTLGGKVVRDFGSRGQVRSIVLALKLAELVAARERGEVPLFLLDDLSSELDKSRTVRLVESLRDLGAQVFITTTDPTHLGVLPERETLKVRLHEGVVQD
jgi:DNA replication and repair protein RecF